MVKYVILGNYAMVGSFPFPPYHRYEFREYETWLEISFPRIGNTDFCQQSVTNFSVILFLPRSARRLRS